MEYRRLGRTGLDVSLLSLGTGGPNKFGQARSTARDATRALVRRALDHGINYFDTAADYGESEELLGRALADVPRESYVLATKYLALVDYNDPTSPVVPPAAVGESVDRSLDRLGVEHVDILMIHALEDLPRYESCIASHLRELERIRDSGKARFLGISGFAPMLVRAVQNGFADMVMVSYNLLSPAPERLLFPPAQAADVGVVAMTAVRRALAHPDQLAATIADMKARGIVASDAVPDDDPLGWLVRGDVRSIQDAAYRFVAEPAAVATVLTGTIDPGHLDANVRAIEAGPLPPEVRTKLLAIFDHHDGYFGN